MAGNYILRKLNLGIMSMCVIGLGLSYYTYVVKMKKEQDDSYEAVCDISESISCTKVFMSEYGKGFGLFPKDSVFNIPNSIYGFVFYTLLAILNMFNNYVCTVTVVILGIISDIFSIYLSYILFLLKDLCIVCITTYLVNMVITWLAINKLQKLPEMNIDILKRRIKEFKKS